MNTSPTQIAMGDVSKYWTLVKIDVAGNRQIQEIASAKAFFLDSLEQFLAQSEVPDGAIQRQLLHWMREASEDVRCLATYCLQCFISHQIDQVCQNLAAQFGKKHGFTGSDLLPFVLGDDGRKPSRNVKTPISTSYKSLIDEILESFDSEQSSLATWTSRRVKHHKELNAFLLEHGVYLVSDWAILNDTNSKQLQRIFSQFHQLTSVEIQQAQRLLESYHAVYRAQRLKQRLAGVHQGQCPPPTTEQLQQIAQRLSHQINKMLSPASVLTQLQVIASRLREYRVHVRGGALPTQSIDTPTQGASPDRTPIFEVVDNRGTIDEQTEFLDNYREQFLISLDQVIAQVIQERVNKIQGRNPEKAQKFLRALQLFHCQGQSMTEIAKAVQLKAQFQVSRLLNLKAFRSDIQQQLLVQLRDRVFHTAKDYTDPKRLVTISHQIEAALDEEITKMMQAAATEASTATIYQNQVTSSFFSQRLCHHLDTRRTQQ